jgi:hypothetical protein
MNSIRSDTSVSEALHHAADGGRVVDDQDVGHRMLTHGGINHYIYFTAFLMADLRNVATAARESRGVTE